MARRAVAGQRATQRVSACEAIDEFLRDVIRREVRPSTVLWYDDKLRVFLATFGETLLDAINRADLVTWLNGLPCRDGGRRHYGRALRALWRWAQRHDPPLVGSDVTLGLLPRKVRAESTIHFLTVAECEKILTGAGRYRSAIALSVFAGLRPEEIAGKGKPWLRWEHVQRKERIVHVPAEISKTRRARNLEKLSPAFWIWLQSGDGEISSGRSRQITEHCAKMADYGEDRPWPHDALRQTFATYAVAATMDPGRVSRLLQAWPLHNVPKDGRGYPGPPAVDLAQARRSPRSEPGGTMTNGGSTTTSQTWACSTSHTLMLWPVCLLDKTLTDWKAGCGRTACPVWREGRGIPMPRPHSYHFAYLRLSLLHGSAGV